MKFVAIIECASGYMEGVGIYDTMGEAFGSAYLKLTEDADDEDNVSAPCNNEGETGWVMELRKKDEPKVVEWATILRIEENYGA